MKEFRWRILACQILKPAHTKTLEDFNDIVGSGLGSINVLARDDTKQIAALSIQYPGLVTLKPAVLSDDNRVLLTQEHLNIMISSEIKV